MATLYITSSEPYSGKSALSIGLGKRFQRDGYKVGYMKPVSRTTRCIEGQRTDEDAAFMREVFDLKEPLTALAPICIDYVALENAMKGEGVNHVEVLKKAFDEVSRDKDVVLLEGGNRLMEGCIIGLPTYKVSRLLDAKDLVLVKWSGCEQADYLLAAQLARLAKRYPDNQDLLRRLATAEWRLRVWGSEDRTTKSQMLAAGLKYVLLLAD